jgi:hypothetical protein
MITKPPSGLADGLTERHDATMGRRLDAVELRWRNLFESGPDAAAIAHGDAQHQANPEITQGG